MNAIISKRGVCHIEHVQIVTKGRLLEFHTEQITPGV